MIKKIMSFQKFLRCDTTKLEKAKALIKYILHAGQKNVIVGNNIFKITKL